MAAFALVLHAHLPYVRHDDRPFDPYERWLHEALWECYLPLLELLDRFAAERVHAPFTLSVSPTLVAMLGDPVLGARFVAHLDALDDLNRRGHERSCEAAAACHARRLALARATWSRLRGDVLGALARHHLAGRIELCTTAATHAFLPALFPAAVAAQLALGTRCFAGYTGIAPAGRWLPECGFDARVEHLLVDAGVSHTVVAEHALPGAPIARSRRGLICFARDRQATLRVWSQRWGYPGAECYRDFYRDRGDDPDGVLGAGTTTGLKYWRIGGRGEKMPYDPEAAVAAVERDAADYAGWLEARAAPLVVAAFDAELFGHFWFEGPAFLEAVLRRLASSRRGPVTLSGWLEAAGAPRACREVLPSSWGRGGHARVWVGARSSRLLRHVHHTRALVTRAAPRARGELGARALDQAIRELVLLEASDWPFMLELDRTRAYAQARLGWHRSRALRFAAVAAGSPASADDRRELAAPRGFLHELAGTALKSGLS